jgi:hypothetical protein
MSIATLRELSASENDDVLTEMLTVGLDRSVAAAVPLPSFPRLSLTHGIFLLFRLMAFTLITLLYECDAVTVHHV